MTLLTACQTPIKETNTLDNNLVKNSYQATEQLIHIANTNADITDTKLNAKSPLIVASFVDVNQMEQSSALGRIIAEQISSKLSQKGYYVVELKLRKNIFIKESAGEFLLSRKIKEITNNHNAQGIVVGTYAAGVNHIYITAKIINPSTNRIISSIDFRLPMNEDTRELLSSW